MAGWPGRLWVTCSHTSTHRPQCRQWLIPGMPSNDSPRRRDLGIERARLETDRADHVARAAVGARAGRIEVDAERRPGLDHRVVEPDRAEAAAEAPAPAAAMQHGRGCDRRHGRHREGTRRPGDERCRGRPPERDRQRQGQGEGPQLEPRTTAAPRVGGEGVDRVAEPGQLADRTSEAAEHPPRRHVDEERHDVEGDDRREHRREPVREAHRTQQRAMRVAPEVESRKAAQGHAEQDREREAHRDRTVPAIAVGPRQDQAQQATAVRSGHVASRCKAGARRNAPRIAARFPVSGIGPRKTSRW